MAKVKKYEFPNRELHESRVVGLVMTWQEKLDLAHIEISNMFSQQLRGEEDGGDAVDTTAAVTAGEWHYRSATITWYLPAVASMNDKGLEEVVVHELCHVLMAPLANHIKGGGSDKLEELATENVARALLKMGRA